MPSKIESTTAADEYAKNLACAEILNQVKAFTPERILKSNDWRDIQSLIKEAFESGFMAGLSWRDDG